MIRIYYIVYEIITYLNYPPQIWRRMIEQKFHVSILYIKSILLTLISFEIPFFPNRQLMSFCYLKWRRTIHILDYDIISCWELFHLKFYEFRERSKNILCHISTCLGEKKLSSNSFIRKLGILYSLHSNHDHI